MHIDVLPSQQRNLAKLIGNWPPAKDFYLAGGTALTLQIGHRRSADFDFFSKKAFSAEKLLENIEDYFKMPVRVLQIDNHTLTILLKDVRVSFFGAYGFPLIGKLLRDFYFPVASAEDIFAMKLLAIQHRTEMKDYVDILALIEQSGINLQKGISLAQKKFSASFNSMISLKALVYFDDLDSRELFAIAFVGKKSPINFKLLKQKLISEVRSVQI
ncbi:nucleotidyl transferase AbiEii/AbiGii toxin family protein [Candidatus Peregrinibacteria bacterium]|nr:nucleotidyl transferase AbiEii/AbiGii toxin family protein [Candidatus Peregrinibacteria bacterium]